MPQKKAKGTKLAVFSDKAGRANGAIFDVLSGESPQTIKQILKKIGKYEGLEEMYYASLIRRLHSLQESSYIGETAKEGFKGQKRYELRLKAYLAMFLKENSIQDIIDQASDTQAAHILLALLNLFSPEKN
jgi:predicted transcriptional regulator